MIPYSNGASIDLSHWHVRILHEHDNKAFDSRRSAVRRIASNYPVECMSWLADHWRTLDTRLFTKLLSKGVTLKMARDNETIWVKNNLTESELEELDSSYPTLDVIENLVAEAIANEIRLTLTWDRKSESYVTYCNQGVYACSGRSTTSLDSLVIGLYKCALCDFQLHEHAGKDSKRPKRG